MWFERRSLVGVSWEAPLQVEVDLLVVPLFEGDRPDLVPGLDAATGGHVARALEAGTARAKAFQIFSTAVLADTWRACRVALIGAGRESDYTPERARKLATAAGLSARDGRFSRLAFLDRPGSTPDRIQAIAEGLMLADFESGTYKAERDTPSLSTALVVPASASDAALARAVERGAAFGAASNEARGLANEPGNRLTPTRLAEQARTIAGRSGLVVEVLDEQGIAALNMGLLLGVAQGSAEPPRLIVLRYDPPGAPAAPVLGLVGKGITFDSGGISIKPADGMDRMKDDMSGGAAVICAMEAIATLGAPVRVVGVVPATENMPGGRATKPGDILTAASGTTVEIINTDAEGRLVLGDALWYARRLGATHLVDVATLTGACVVALGKTTTGLFGTPRAWVDVVEREANRAGDRAWPLPLFEDYDDQLRSEIADLINSAGRPAGAITAAMFLKRFAGAGPWAHLDIAGTAWAEEAKPYQPKGATGVAVRTLAGLAVNGQEWMETVGHAGAPRSGRGGFGGEAPV